MSSNGFVEVKPVQTDRKHRTLVFGDVITRIKEFAPYNGRYFSKHLTFHRFKKILEKSNVNMSNVSLIRNPNDMIIYQYENKPLIALDLKDGRFYTTKGTLEHYDLELIQHQAYIVLSILRKHGYSKAKPKKCRYERMNCKVCQSPHRVEYEQMYLDKGMYVKDIWRYAVTKYGENISYPAFSRHFRYHVKQALEIQKKLDRERQAEES